MATTSGFEKEVELTETLTHSGIFKGLVKFVYGKRAEPKKPAEPVEGAEGDIEPRDPDPLAFLFDAAHAGKRKRAEKLAMESLVAEVARNLELGDLPERGDLSSVTVLQSSFDKAAEQLRSLINA